MTAEDTYNDLSNFEFDGNVNPPEVAERDRTRILEDFQPNYAFTLPYMNPSEDFNFSNRLDHPLENRPRKLSLFETVEQPYSEVGPPLNQTHNPPVKIGEDHHSLRMSNLPLTSLPNLSEPWQP